MKTILLKLLLIILASVRANSQNILRCNNDPTVSLTTGMYRTAQEAHDAANVGDIIYLEPSLFSYGNLAITKTLKIYGNGYFHNENSGSFQNWNKKPSILGNVQINNAPNTILEGVTIGTSQTYGIITIYSPNVVVKRSNLMFGFIDLRRNQNGTWNASGTQIVENFIPRISTPISSLNTPAVENIVIKNNISGYLSNNLMEGNIPSGTNFIITGNTSFGEILNCQNCTVQNNIFHYPSPQGIFANGLSFGSTASNNLCILRPCIQGSNNIDNLTEGDLYNLPPGSTSSFDNYYILKENSVAKTAGIGGIEAGAFGGSSPYKLSGLSSIPQITSYSETTSNGIYTANHPMSVTISIKSNN